MRRFGWALLLAVASSASAQLIAVPPHRVIAKLGPCTDGSPKLVAVTNAATSTDCSVGGGSLEVLCFCHDGAWGAGGVGPQGETGEPGDPGQSATVAAGTTTTGAPGSSASVVNVGTSSAAILNFLIPRGDVGATGSTGATGATGSKGDTGETGSPGSDGIPRTVQDEGSDLPQRLKLNCVGSGISCADDGTTTVLNVPGGLSGPGSSTDRSVAVFSGTSGSTLAGSTATVDASGNLFVPGLLKLGQSSGPYPALKQNGNELFISDSTGTGARRLGAYEFDACSDPSCAELYFFRMGAIGISSGSSRSIDLSGSGASGHITIGVNGGRPALEVATLATPSALLSIADNGSGTRASATLTPASSLIRCSCADPDGCDVTLSETNALDGQELRIVNSGTNVCSFAEAAGVTELAGSADLGPQDSLSLIYASDRFVELARSNN